jgi:hypothetical protein
MKPRNCKYQNKCDVYLGFEEFCPRDSKLCIIAKVETLDEIERRMNEGGDSPYDIFYSREKKNDR